MPVIVIDPDGFYHVVCDGFRMLTTENLIKAIRYHASLSADLKMGDPK